MRAALVGKKKRKAKPRPEPVPEEYTYIYLLQRAKSMKVNGSRVLMIPPADCLIENHRTCFANIGKVCRSINRTPESLAKFITKEFNTEASFRKDDALYIKGKFDTGKINTLIREFVKRYVQCSSCKYFQTTAVYTKKYLRFKCEICNEVFRVEL